MKSARRAELPSPTSRGEANQPLTRHDGTMTSPESPITIDVGDATVSGVFADPDGAFGTLVVAHGAGAGMDHPFLQGFTRALNSLGVATLRFNFPYREAGKKFPDRPPAAIAAWRAAMDAAASRSGWSTRPVEVAML